MTDENKLNRENVAIILVESRAAGNIGSVARAMVNMGFQDLRLVNPQINHLNMEARWLAHASEHILESAGVFSSLQEAVEDWAEKEISRLDNEAKFFRSVLQGRGIEEAGTQNLSIIAEELGVEIDAFISATT